MTLFGIDLHISWPLGLAVYFTFWWVCLFAVLPFGVTSLHEAGEVEPGVDPSAPVAPMLARKALATTLVAAVAFGLLLVVLQFTEG
jgi:predicted secreted protein